MLHEKHLQRQKYSHVNVIATTCRLVYRATLNRVYKTVNHRLKHNEFILSRDIEKNPGPYPYTVIDPNKTIFAPYSQGNVGLFGQNAGRQCVAMSMCTLIYNHRSAIMCSGDLVNIMDTGNELYSILSRLYNQ